MDQTTQDSAKRKQSMNGLADKASSIDFAAYYQTAKSQSAEVAKTPVQWAKKHPWATVLSAAAVGLLAGVLFVRRRSDQGTCK